MNFLRFICIVVVQHIRGGGAMGDLKVLEWNVNQYSSSKDVPEYVINEIVRKNPDIIVLVEFKGINNAKLMEENLLDYYVTYY